MLDAFARNSEFMARSSVTMARGRALVLVASAVTEGGSAGTYFGDFSPPTVSLPADSSADLGVHRREGSVRKLAANRRQF
jgi:hypothetical protein